MTTHTKTKGNGKQGFASMTPEEKSRIASLGGKAAWAAGKAHHWTSATAQAAGRKGGLRSKRRKVTPKTQE